MTNIFESKKSFEVIKTPVELLINNILIKGNLFTSTAEGVKPGVIFIHGWGSSQKNSLGLAESLAKNSTVYTFDLRGHGDSEGDRENSTRAMFLDDIEKVYDWFVNNKNVDISRVFVCGTSFGAYLATILSKSRKIQGLILRAPANYPDDEFENDTVVQKIDNPQLSTWRKQTSDYNETKSLRSLHDFTGKILIVESDNDTVVPHATISNYINTIEDKDKLNHFVLKDAQHSISNNPQARLQFEEICLNWIRKQI